MWETIVGAGIAAAAGLGGIYLGQILGIRSAAAERKRADADEREQADRARVVRLLQLFNQYETVAGGVLGGLVSNAVAVRDGHPRPISSESLQAPLNQANEIIVRLGDVTVEVQALGPSWARTPATELEDLVTKATNLLYPSAPGDYTGLNAAQDHFNLMRTEIERITGLSREALAPGAN